MRLRQVVGAGGRVPPKPDGIGAKNHGLRTGYWLGDEIIVRSAGKRMRFALFGDGPKKPPNPFAFESDGAADDPHAARPRQAASGTSRAAAMRRM